MVRFKNKLYSFTVLEQTVAKFYSSTPDSFFDKGVHTDKKKERLFKIFTAVRSELSPFAVSYIFAWRKVIKAFYLE